MIEVRPAQPGDGAAICHVQHVGWLYTYPNEEHGVTRQMVFNRGMESPERTERREKQIAEHNDSCQSWVGEINGRIVGWCVAEKGKERNELASLYVLPIYHGQGVGGQLMRTALEWLGDDKEIFLHVVAYNHKAISVYEHFGFVDAGEYVYEKGPFEDGPNMASREMVRPARSS